ncbi:MAG: Peptidase ClpP [Chthoniobacteraceae bacterium]|nr:Peptidase ClpP [Chthoniobacteraceae bacterium]
MATSAGAEISSPSVGTNAASVSVAISSGRTVDAQTINLQEEREKLVIENQVRDETLRKTLFENSGELQRLKLEAELARARAERELTEQRISIDKARIEAEHLNAKLVLENARRLLATQSTLADLRAAKERAELEAELASAAFSKKNNELRTEELASNAHLNELRTKLALREKELEENAYADQRPVYLKDPLKSDGSLVLSDRRIALNGPITMETADQVSDRIDYFNNKTHEFPIFLVIDDSPGGSVMAGYKILKSMQSSTAPVYVVVKSFAASMAAAITTLAERSFAYPNAIILHHQISAGSAGNLTIQRESVKTLEEWWHRLAAPIAAKMGISIEDFIKQMYAHTATGDWKEFADNAAKLKWVDVVVGRCQETAWTKNPDFDRSPSTQVAASVRAMEKPTEKIDAKGHPFMALPRLNPIDCYYLYNPDGYFRPE